MQINSVNNIINRNYAKGSTPVKEAQQAPSAEISTQDKLISSNTKPENISHSEIRNNITANKAENKKSETVKTAENKNTSENKKSKAADDNRELGYIISNTTRSSSSSMPSETSSGSHPGIGFHEDYSGIGGFIEPDSSGVPGFYEGNSSVNSGSSGYYDSGCGGGGEDYGGAFLG